MPLVPSAPRRRRRRARGRSTSGDVTSTAKPPSRPPIARALLPAAETSAWRTPRRASWPAIASTAAPLPIAPRFSSAPRTREMDGARGRVERHAIQADDGARRVDRGVVGHAAVARDEPPAARQRRGGDVEGAVGPPPEVLGAGEQREQLGIDRHRRVGRVAIERSRRRCRRGRSTTPRRVDRPHAGRRAPSPCAADPRRRAAPRSGTPWRRDGRAATRPRSGTTSAARMAHASGAFGDRRACRSPGIIYHIRRLRVETTRSMLPRTTPEPFTTPESCGGLRSRSRSYTGGHAHDLGARPGGGGVSLRRGSARGRRRLAAVPGAGWPGDRAARPAAHVVGDRAREVADGHSRPRLVVADRRRDLACGSRPRPRTARPSASSPSIARAARSSRTRRCSRWRRRSSRTASTPMRRRRRSPTADASTSRSDRPARRRSTRRPARCCGRAATSSATTSAAPARRRSSSAIG